MTATATPSKSPRSSVWRVEDTAQALFAVDDVAAFVALQSESAVRHIASSHPYEPRAGAGLALRSHTEAIAGTLGTEVAARVRGAGVRIIEARITRLAYAPEIAGAMLQRQQADAVVAARQRIVEGAVGMVEMALARLAEEHVVTLDDERKAAMVSNLLVVLCGDRAAQPIVNAGWAASTSPASATAGAASRTGSRGVTGSRCIRALRRWASGSGSSPGATPGRTGRENRSATSSAKASC